MKSKLKLILTLAMVSTVLLTACQPQQPASLEGSWLLTELDRNPVPADVNIYMLVDSDRLSGNDGCNQFSASYTVEGDSFAIGEDSMSTLMACEEPIMQRADEFNKALQNSAKYKLTSKQLQLLDQSGKVLAVFEAQSQELAGTSWLATFVMTESPDDISSLSSVQAAKPTLTFGIEGQLNGNAGCNNYFADYKVDGNTLTIGDTGATAKLCEDDIMAEEADFFAALSKVVSYQITGTTLQLRDVDDNTLISFTRQ